MQEPSQKIRTLVVDDEPWARTNLKALLGRETDIELVGESGDGRDAVRAIRDLRPDLVFLDIQMPECDGFDVLEMLGADQPAAIVFVTAYDSHALKAFDVGALDYLLKPIGDERFGMALLRARERLKQHRESRQKEPVRRLVLKSAGQVIFLNTADIDWIGAADYYVSLHVGPRTHLLRRGLVELEQDLDPAAFCRIHRSTIINLDRLCSLELNADGEYEALLKNGVRLKVSRTYRKRLAERAASAA